MRKTIHFSVGFLSIFIISSGFASTITKMHNARYCEVILGNLQKGEIILDVYNSYGLNNCPESNWQQLSVEKIRQQTGKPIVMLNGPRYFLANGAINNAKVEPKIMRFGQLDMRRSGVLMLPLKDRLNQTSYTERQVKRDTVWLFDKGVPVYQLQSPDDSQYVMQSYSNQKIKQSLQSLKDLGNKLKLPKGWAYKVIILDKPLRVSTKNGIATVIQDEYMNTYQKK